MDRARRLLRSGNFPEAERLCRQLLQSDPGHAESWHLLGGALQWQAKHAEAVATYQQSLRLRPDSADCHFALTSALARQRERDAAMTHYRTAVRLHPGHVKACSNFAVLPAERGSRGRPSPCCAR